MKILISIKPKYVSEILKGNKLFEFRKKNFKEKEVESVLIYSTLPVGKVVAEFKIKSIYEDTPENIWLKTNKFSGINKDDFFDYYKNRKNAVAIEISDLIIYEKPLLLNEIKENLKAPQSYCYIK